ncbi:hypothetical protein EF849_22590, partial [Aeromonas jandaei]|nr:hypothetical protein [Aeromonas jandaei]
MPRNEPLLVAASHFWSDALNAFVFGHGIMTITLADVFMMSGLNITSTMNVDELLEKITQRSIDVSVGWMKYVEIHNKVSVPIAETEHRAF